MGRQWQGWRGLVVAAAIAALGLTWLLNHGSSSAEPPPPKRARRSGDVVQVRAAAAKPGADGKQVVTVTLTIDQGWHLYANPIQDKQLPLPQDFAGVATEVALTLNGQTTAAKVDYPEGKLVQNFGGAYRVYEDTVTIQATVDPQGVTGTLGGSLTLQACNDAKRTCLPPQTLALTIP